MKRVLQILVVVLLLAIATFQLLVARGILSGKEEQEVCPVNAIYMDHGKAKIDSLKCIGCGRCVDGFLAIPMFSGKEVEANSIALDTKPQAVPAGSSSITDQPIPVAEDNPTPVPKKMSQPASEPSKSTDQADDVAVEPAQAYHVVDASACIACGFCLRVCPEKAISYKAGKAFIDPDKCINCGICAGAEPRKFRGCPVDAIHPANPDSSKS